MEWNLHGSPCSKVAIRRFGTRLEIHPGEGGGTVRFGGCIVPMAVGAESSQRTSFIGRCGSLQGVDDGGSCRWTRRETVRRSML